MPPERSAQDAREDEPPVPSPCVSVCVLDPAGSGICTGCGRSIDEIAAWVDLGNAQRREVIARLPQRLAALRARNRNQGWGDRGGDTDAER